MTDKTSQFNLLSSIYSHWLIEGGRQGWNIYVLHHVDFFHLGLKQKAFLELKKKQTCFMYSTYMFVHTAETSAALLL